MDNKTANSGMESDMESESGPSFNEFISREELSSGRILKDVLINPINPNHFRRQNYLLTLGNHYFSCALGVPINPESSKSNKAYWGPSKKAELLPQVEYEKNKLIAGQRYIKIHAGKTILAHTHEFIGVSDGMSFLFRPLSTMLSCSISVEAGQGGHYYDRCILSITNKSDGIAYLREGSFIIEVSFYRTANPATDSGFGKDKNALKQIEEVWKAENLLIRKVKNIEKK